MLIMYTVKNATVSSLTLPSSDFQPLDLILLALSTIGTSEDL